MRIVKYEKIFLSPTEASVWTKFEQILNGLEREIENPDTLNLVDQIQEMLSDLSEQVEASE